MKTVSTKAPGYDIDIVHQDERERARRCVDEAFIYVLKPGTRKEKEAAILRYRHNRDMALLDKKWKLRRRKRKQ
jgi:hypothetical protein